MKKATFNITTIEGAKEVSGYVYIVAGDRVGVHGENGYWTVTDLLTGCVVADGKTIKKAVLSAMDKAPAIRKAREVCKAKRPEWIKTANYNPDKYTECTYQLITVTPFTQEV